MVWDRSKYVLLVAGFLVLANTGLPFDLSSCFLLMMILVWGFLGMSQSLLMKQSKFVPIFMWSIFGLNIVISGLTGKFPSGSHVAPKLNVL